MGSKEGFAADKAGAAAEGKMLGGTSNDGSSKNFAKEGSQLVEVLKEFPSKMQTEKLAHGSPFFWTEEKDGSKKKLTYMGGYDAMCELATTKFADNKDVQYQNISAWSFGGLCVRQDARALKLQSSTEEISAHDSRRVVPRAQNVFNNPTPGYTVPDPLA